MRAPDAGAAPRRARAAARAQGAVVAAALVLLLLVLLPLRPAMPLPGLDPSWTYALNEAVAQHRVFGRDFVFSFGPLAALYTRAYHPATDALALAGAAIVALAAWGGCLVVARPRRRWLVALLPLLVAASELRDAAYMLVALLLPFAAFATGPGGVPSAAAPEPVRPRRWPRGLAFAALAVANGLLPLSKASFGVLVAGEGALALVLLLRQRRRALAAAVVALGLVALAAGWLAAGQPLAALPAFFVAEWPVVAGFGEAMSAHGAYAAAVCWIVAAALVAALFFLGYGWRRAQGGLVWLALCLYLFLAFKAGFVRQDGHERLSAAALPTIALLGALVLPARGAALGALVAIVGWFAVERSSAEFGLERIGVRVHAAADDALDGLALRLRRPSPLPRRFAEANAAIRRAEPLPPVDGSADVYPDELAALFAAGLPWAGRPVPQSYSVFTAPLAALDAAHLAGAEAPRHVFFEVAPIDGRLPTLEDAASWPVLLSDYALQERAGRFLHFVRVADGAGPAPLPLATLRADVGVAIEVPAADAPVWAAIELRPTLLGRLVAQLFRLPRVELELSLDDGRTLVHRYVPAMGRDGFLLSPYLGTNDDVVALVAGVDRGARVRRLRVLAPGLGLWRTQCEVTFSALRLPVRPDAARLLDPAPPRAAGAP
ncbi:MAG TPA: hypothetical protein VGC30_05390 [Dokdonella sp.]